MLQHKKIIFFTLFLLTSCSENKTDYLKLNNYLYVDKMNSEYQTLFKKINETIDADPEDQLYSDKELVDIYEKMILNNRLLASIYETIKFSSLLKESHQTYTNTVSPPFFSEGIKSYVSRPIESFKGDKLIVGTGWKPKYFCATPFYAEWALKNKGLKIDLEKNLPTLEGRQISPKFDQKRCIKHIEEIKKEYYSVDIDPEMEPDFIASVANPVHMTYLPTNRFSYVLFDYFPADQIIFPLVWDNIHRILKKGAIIQVITGYAYSKILRATLMRLSWTKSQLNKNSKITKITLKKH